MSKNAAFVIVGMLAAVAVVVGGIAYASIPDGSGVIHGCTLKNIGILRVVDDASKCRPWETPLDWNAQGQVGEKGEKGEPGQGIGAPYVKQTEEVVTADDQLVFVDCNPGDTVLSGGYDLLADTGVLTAEASAPNNTSSSSGWLVRVGIKVPPNGQAVNAFAVSRV